MMKNAYIALALAALLLAACSGPSTRPEGAPEPDAEMVKMITWFNEHGYEADIPALRKTYPGLKTLETWAREAGFDAAVATA